jgi:hypothetical protein
MKLGMETRREFLETYYRRYQQVGKQEKKEILDEMAGMTGLNDDHNAPILRSVAHDEYNSRCSYARRSLVNLVSLLCHRRIPVHFL